MLVYFLYGYHNSIEGNKPNNIELEFEPLPGIPIIETSSNQTQYQPTNYTNWVTSEDCDYSSRRIALKIVEKWYGLLLVTMTKFSYNFCFAIALSKISG